EDGVEAADKVAEGEERDEAGEDERRLVVAELQALGREIAARGAEREGEEDGGPVERLAPRRVDGVDGERPFARVPGGEGEKEREPEGDRRRLEADSEIVDEVVGDERADDADEDDREPIGPGHVFAVAEL